MAGLLSSLATDPTRHLYRLAQSPNYRTLCALTSRYGRTPRHTPRRVRVHGWELDVVDVASFLAAYGSIFVNHCYAFRSGTQSPLILDCGANIGLSTLYFKRAFPNARIIAFEPDPRVYEALVHNVHGNGYSD